MGYYNYLCELLRPLRVYRLDEGSLSGAELYAALCVAAAPGS